MRFSKIEMLSAIYSLAGIIALLVFAFGIVPCALHAQAGTADVLGTVTDQTGALIPGAAVTLTNTDTGIIYKTTSGANGEYLFTALQNGVYSIEVSKQEFKVFTSNDIPVTTGQRARVDVAMETGAVTEKVVVTTEVAALQADSSTVTSTIESNAVQSLPMEDRNYYTVIDNLAGLSGATNQGNSGRTGGGISNEYDSRPGSTVIANGQSDLLNDNLVNGFENNEVAYGGTGVRPTVDGIQEMKVDTAMPAAEFGRAAGAVVNIITKAGTNNFHGSLFEYLRNQITDAQTYSFGATTVTPPYHQNNFGGSLGGPIFKNKTFFFFGIENDRIDEASSTGLLRIPTTYEYNQLQKGIADFTDIGGSVMNQCTETGCNSYGYNPSDPTQNYDVSPFLLRMAQLYPKPNFDTSTGDETSRGFGYYVVNPVATQRILDYEIRIDQNFSPKDKLFVRWADNPATGLNPPYFPAVPVAAYGVTGLTDVSPNGNAPSGGLHEATYTKNIQIDYVHTLSASLILDLKAGYSRYNTSALGLNAGTGIAQAFGEPNAVAKGALGDDLPFVGGPPGTYPYQSIGGGNEQPFHNVEGAYQYSAAATYVHKSHEIKIGAGMIRRQAFVDQTHTAAGFYFCGGAGPLPVPMENCLAGFTGQFLQRQTPVFNNIYRDREWSVYGQDNWRLTSKITANLGVRYDIFTPYNDAHGYVSNFNAATLGDGLTPDAHNFILGGTGGVNTDYGAIVPRLGVEYSLRPNTVVRGGFGMVYIPFNATPAPGVTQMNGGAQNPPYYFYYQNGNIQANLTDALGAGLKNPVYWPDPVAIDLANLNTDAALTGVVNTPRGAKDERIFQTNLAVQQQVGANTFTLAFVGVFDRDAPNQIDYDKPNMPGNATTISANGTPVPCYNYTNTNTPYGCNSGAAVFNYINSMQSYLFNGLSNYEAMQAIYDRHLSKGLSVNANWTYSHALGTVSGASAQGAGNPNNTGIDSLFYAPEGQDLRHRIAVTATYALPFGQSLNGVAREIFKGWQFNSIFQWQTGSAITLFASAGCNYGPTYANVGAGPFAFGSDPNCPSDLLPGPSPTYTLQPNQQYYYPKIIGKFWKPGQATNMTEAEYANIVPPAPGTDGNPSSATAFGPRFWQENLSAMKDFPIREQLKLQFRAEVYNLTNTPMFDNPALNIGSWTANSAGTGLISSNGRGFGQITSTNGEPRRFQFALRLQF
jgi:hypothetical protein